MKRFLSAFLAVSMILSLTACGGNTESTSSPTESVSQTDGTDTSAGTETPPAEEAPLSNPVALTEDGDIDMEKALAYQTDFEALKASLDAKTVDPSKPVSENSNEDTLEVFNYLYGIYGKQMLSCQQMENSKALEDIVYYDATGDLPAMKGFDFIFCTGSYINEAMVDDAITWHKECGGLVTFTWHWNVPVDVDDHSMGYAFYQEDIKNWDQIKAVTPGTKEYEQVIHDIDLIATKLQRLEKEGITVLFRPLHEASGSWFWWGLQGKPSAENEVFQKLWYMIFDRMENYHKLTNIIWVWNGQSKHCKVSPNAYDIAGVDYYANSEDHSAQKGQYDNLKAMTDDSGKMLALSECGYIPDPADCAANDAMWLYYMTWNGDFIYDRVSFDGTPSPADGRLTSEMLAEYFANDIIVSHKDLPAFRTGTKNIPQAIKNWEFFKNAS